MMKIMGIDPGTARTGVGIIEGDKRRGFKCVTYLCITTTANSDMDERLREIHKVLTKEIKKHRPDVIAVEELFFNTNPKTVMSVGRAAGAIILTSSLMGLKVYEFTPLQVKMAISGYGRADKTQVQKMIMILL